MAPRLVAHVLSSVLLFFVAAGAAPALAMPALFSGSVSITTPRLTVPSVVVPQVGPGIVSVTASSPAGFTLPAKTFVGSSSPTGGGFPYYPVLSGMLMRSNAVSGTFGSGFIAPGATVLFLANPTMSPNATMSPRAGYIKLKAGSKGFGGGMKLVTTGAYGGVWVGSPISYTSTYFALYQSVMGFRGTFPTTNPSAVLGSRVYISPEFAGIDGTGGTITSAGAATQMPWFTGMVTAYEPAGAFPTLVTAVGSDARTPLGMSGNISLVSPQILHIFISALGFTVKGEAFASTATINLSFLPEPARVVLLGAGALGLLLLSRSGRRLR